MAHHAVSTLNCSDSFRSYDMVKSLSVVEVGAHIKPNPNFMGLASLGLDIGIFCDSQYSVLLLSVLSGLDFSGLALSRPQVEVIDRQSKLYSVAASPGR